MAKEYKDLVVGLDIGTSKVMVVVAEVMPGGELKLAGLGIAASNGLKRGVVVNIDATVQSIQQALKEAELMADCKIARVYTGITSATTTMTLLVPISSPTTRSLYSLAIVLPFHFRVGFVPGIDRGDTS